MRAKTKSSAVMFGFILVMAMVAVAQEKNPERNAYFGETHVHTSWSFDAFIFGNHVTGPADAYKYARASPSSIRSATHQD